MKGSIMNGMTALSIAVLLLLAAPAPAQQKGGIVLTSVSEVEVTKQNAEGKKEVKRIDAAMAKVVPGDMVIFTVSYANSDTKPADRVLVINPVPQHMAYLDKSAEGTGAVIEFSVDGGKTYAAPGKLLVTAEGKQRPAAASDYTHIRWTISKPLAPGAKGSVSFRAVLK
jgi:uncharacterized repeat protein (TIGR01451 family)